jgi:signal peptidase I
MRKTAKFIIALAISLLLMLVFRAVAFTICTIDGEGLAPLLVKGDRVLVNRWSYGLRVGGEGLLVGYHRLCRRPVSRGDIVAFENPQNTSQVIVCRCQATPGDTVTHDGQELVVPGLNTCANADYYWMQAIGEGNSLDSRSLGCIGEQYIIGRVTAVVYSHDPDKPVWAGWRRDRTMLDI